MKHPSQLPAITASLFQSPGGRKFIHFISHFVRFVTKEIIRRSESQVWEPKDLKVEPVKNLLKGFLIQNSQQTKNEFQDFRIFAEKSQNLSSTLSQNFRQMKSDLKEAKSKNVKLTENIQKIEKLRTNCEKLKSENQTLKSDFTIEMEDLQYLLTQIEKIGGQKAEKFVLNLSAYNDPSLKSVLEKLLNSTQDLKLSEQKLSFPNTEIETNFHKAEKQRIKLANLQTKLAQDLNDLKVKNVEYEQSQDSAEVSVLLPMTPGLKIQANPEPKSKFLLDSKLIKTTEMSVCSDLGLKVSTPNTTTAVMMSPEQSRIVPSGKYKLDLTPKNPIKLDSSFDKSGFSSLAEESNQTKRYRFDELLFYRAYRKD